MVWAYADAAEGCDVAGAAASAAARADRAGSANPSAIQKMTMSPEMLRYSLKFAAPNSMNRQRVIHRIMLIVAVLAALGAGCTQASHPPLQRMQYVQLLMGVRVRLVVYARDEPSARSACRAAFDRIADLEDIMSDYRPDSELMRLSSRACQGPIKVSDDLFRVLSYAQDVARRSDGAFDVTVGPMVRLWRAARKSGVLPTPAQIAQARRRVGWRLMRLNARNKTVELFAPGMQLDLGGIAKGDAGDQAIAVLRAQGIRSALFEAGGDIVVSDAPPGKKGWDIQLPAGENGAPKTIIVHDCAVSTSGDSEQFVEIDGKRYSHVVDPHTGIGLTQRVDATITAPRGITTDALSTAVTVLGADRGKKLLREYPDAHGWIGHDATP